MNRSRTVVGLVCLFGALVRASSAQAAVINLSVPNLTQSVPSSTTNFTADVKFSTSGATASLVGYDIAFKITGPSASNLIITGVSTGAARPANAVLADDPTFFTNTSTGTTIYGVSDFLISGTGTITDGSILVELKLQAAAGTTGTYNINFDADSSSALNSLLYSDANLDSVPGLTLHGGSVTFSGVPEPASLSLLGMGGILLCRRRRP